MDTNGSTTSSVLLERAIGSLEQLLGDPDASEQRFQEYFEAYPIVFEALGYSDSIAHPRLAGPTGELIPDFIVRRFDGLYEVCDVKLPTEHIIREKKNRAELYAKISAEYAAQLGNYAEHFDDPANIAAFSKAYGHTVNKSPNKFLIAGRDTDVDRFELHQILHRRGREFQLFTYDDVLNAMKWRLSGLDFGTHEPFGISLSAVFRVRDIQPKERGYLLDFYERETGERFAITFTTDLMSIGITNERNRQEIISMEYPIGANGISEWMYLQFMLGARPGYSRLEIRLNGRFVEGREIATTFFQRRGINYGSRVLGRDWQWNNPLAFDISYLKAFNNYIPFSTRRSEEYFGLNRVADIAQRAVPVFMIEKHAYPPMMIKNWEGTKSILRQSLAAHFDSVNPPAPARGAPID